MSGDLDLGLFPLDMVLLPGERTPLHVFEPRYRQLVADTTLDDQPFVLVQADADRTAQVGCSARFATLVRRFLDGRMSLIAVGERPVELLEETDGRLYFSARIRELHDEPDAPDPDAIEQAEVAFRDLTGITGELPVPAGVARSYGLAGALELPTGPKQELLELRVENERLTLLTRALRDLGRETRHMRMAAERAQTNGKVASP